MRYLLNLKYDGSSYYGSQKQNKQKTIIGELEKILSKIFNENIKVVGCSRTDRGVHALDYYAHFDSDKKRDIKILKYSINKMIEDDIYIKDVTIVSNEFHSRFDVKEKEYVYKIYVGEYNPILRNYCLEYNRKINVSLMKKVAKKLCGYHNFKAFTTDTDENKCNRNIKYIKVIKKDQYVYVYIASSGFLKYMVRNIIGLMIEINEGRKKLEIIDILFLNKDRSENAKTISPNGLYLNKVKY